MNLGKLGVWTMLDPLAPATTAAAAKRIEALGYSALWIPNLPASDPLVQSSWLLANTETLIVATGVANIHQRTPAAMAGAQVALDKQSGGRFLLGLGVSGKWVVEDVIGVAYTAPLETMRRYLDRLDAALAYIGNTPSLPRVLAAVGPKMLALSKQRSLGAHPYFMTPDHTRRARALLGPDAWLCVEQKIVLDTNADRARTAARAAARIYMTAPHYRRGWNECGLDDSEFEHGGSDRFIDATFSWGSADRIKARIAEHVAAGASHVCIQPIHPDGAAAGIHWPALEALAP
jgi:probable F420-dependent oxidoreductase